MCIKWTESLTSHHSYGMWHWIAGKVFLDISQRLVTSALASSNTRALLGTFVLEDEVITILRNVGNHSPNDILSHLKTHEAFSNTAGRALRKLRYITFRTIQVRQPILLYRIIDINRIQSNTTQLIILLNFWRRIYFLNFSTSYI